MWFKVDDHLHDHGKVRRIDYDLPAMGLWVLAGSWCGQNSQDGFVPATVARRWPGAKRAAAKLVAAGLWAEASEGGEPGWQFANWSEYNPKQAESMIPLENLRWRRKQALKKNRALCAEIVERDGGLCRYCGNRVNFQDRKGPGGGTYDHVNPDGDNTLANVVVACRRCNGRKRDRTPTEAGMELRPAPSSTDPAPEGAKSSSPSGSFTREAVRDQIGSGSVRLSPARIKSGRVPGRSQNGAKP